LPFLLDSTAGREGPYLTALPLLYASCLRGHESDDTFVEEYEALSVVLYAAILRTSSRILFRATSTEKHQFTDKQSQIAERKTVESRGRETAGKKPQTKSPTPLTGREHAGDGSRGKSPDPARGPCPRSRE